MDIEEWKAVEGYEGYYEVSNHGRVRSLYRVIKRRGGTLQSVWGGMMSPGLDRDDYLQLNLSRNSAKKCFRVHTLVASHFLVKPAGTDQVNHKDFNKQNNYYKNLEWTNTQPNIAHSVKAGRWAAVTNPNKGRACNLQQVLEIRKLFSEGLSRQELTTLFNLDRTTVYNICLNRTWKLPPENRLPDAILASTSLNSEVVVSD